MLRQVNRKEAVSALSPVLETNNTLTTLVLSGIDSAESDSFVHLGESLAKNPNSSITHLDLSHNEIKDQGVTALASAFSQMKNGLCELNLSSCGISPKGILALMKALDSNHSFSLSIARLDLSFNNSGSTGTIAVANWISNMKQGDQNKSALTELILSGCQLDIFSLLEAIKSSLNDKLQLLNISHNKITKQSVDAVAEFLQDCQALTYLNLSACSLTPEILEQILASANKNNHVNGLTINFAENDLGVNGAKAIASALRFSKHVHTLDLHSNNLKKEGMMQIIKAIDKNNTLKGLNLSNNLNGKTPEVVKGISDLIEANCGLEHLWIADNSLGSEIGTLLKPIASNRKVNFCSRQVL